MQYSYFVGVFFLPDVASGKLKGGCMNQCLRISSDYLLMLISYEVKNV